MKTHILKTVNPYFSKIWTLHKLFEVRKNDRDFQVDDELILQEFDPEEGYLGREIRVKVNYILHDHPGLKPGYIVMQIAVLRFNHLSKEAIKELNKRWKTKLGN